MKRAARRVVVSVSADDLRYLYADGRRSLLGGPVVVARASHVEPLYGLVWTADLRPSGGPVLGPFTTRAQALRAEVQWLEAHSMGERGVLHV